MGERFWLERAVKVVLTARAFLLLVTIVGFGQALNGFGGTVVILAAVVGIVPLAAWARVGSAIERHPAWLALDVLLSGLILGVVGASGPFYYYTLGSAALAGMLHGRFGVTLMSPLLVAVFEGALVIDETRGHAPGLREIVGMAMLYPAAAAFGGWMRRMVTRGADLERALERSRRDAAEERERARIARDLHDSLAKTVEGIAMSASVLARRVTRDPQSAAPLAEQLAEDAGTAAREARTLLDQLRDDGSDGRDEGIVVVNSLRTSLAEEIDGLRDRSGLEIDANLSEHCGLAPDAERQLFLVAREALRNVERHAEAGEVVVRLTGDVELVELDISDDGRGMPEVQPEGHYGVTGMRERVAALGGTMDVGPGPRGGTRVRAVVPVTPRGSTTSTEEVPA